jgi:3-isopropylmalate/(R)-2-methylmalate dehydratase small subunit
MKNGLLAVVLPEETIDELFRLASGPNSFEIVVDLPNQTILLPGGRRVAFDIDADRKRTLVEGRDEIGLTLSHRAAIESFEARHRARMPWLFRGVPGRIDT